MSRYLLFIYRFYLLLYRFFLSDTFGDTWDTAQFFVYDIYKNYKKYTPDCNHNPLVAKYCFNPMKAKDGDTVTASVIGFKPDFHWEVLSSYLKYYVYNNIIFDILN